jgi:MFS family permease
VLGAGGVVDRGGERLTLVAAGPLAALGLLLAAAARGPGLLVLGAGLLFGCAAGAGYAAAIRVAGRAEDPRSRAGALGVVTTAFAAGAVLAAPLLSAAITAYGWRWALVIEAAAVGSLVLAAGLQLDGPRPGGRSEALPACPAAARTIVALGIILGTGSAPALYEFADAPAIAEGSGLGAATAVGLLAGANVAGRLLAGLVGLGVDRTGRRGLSSATGLTGAAFGLLVVGGPTATGAALVMVGACYGALSVLAPAVTAALTGAASLGQAYGRVFIAWGVAGLLAPVGGTRVAALFGHETAFVLGAAVAGSALLASLLLLRAPPASA